MSTDQFEAQDAFSGVTFAGGAVIDGDTGISHIQVSPGGAVVIDHGASIESALRTVRMLAFGEMERHKADGESVAQDAWAKALDVAGHLEELVSLARGALSPKEP